MFPILYHWDHWAHWHALAAIVVLIWGWGLMRDTLYSVPEKESACGRKSAYEWLAATLFTIGGVLLGLYVSVFALLVFLAIDIERYDRVRRIFASDLSRLWRGL